MTNFFQNEIFHGKVGFAIGTGRCGTNFIAKIMQQEQDVASVHERNPLNETFHRYCKWYNLPVDSEGFLQTKENEIRQDLANNHFSFEASAHLSLSVQELYDRFKAKFLLLVRSPERVVNSYLQKKWYEQPVIRADPNLALGYQEYCESFHHSLGRIMPSGEKFLQWNQMSRIGKLAWYWNALNTKVLEQFEGIPETHWRLEKLEDLSYNRYLEIAQFFGFQSMVTQELYEELALYRPNARSRVSTIATWTTNEIDEFEAEVEPMAKKFGYEYRVSYLPIPQPKQTLIKQSLTKKDIQQSYIKVTMQNAIETLFWPFVPIPSQSRFESIRLKLANFGFRYECPLCKARLGSLQSLGENFPVLIEKNVVGGRQRDARCPCCKSSDRERLLYLFLLHQTDLFSRPTKLLHVAPEKRLTKLMVKFSHLDYLTTDLDSSLSRVMEQMDISEIHYPAASFDAILCNHVLEHVPDDIAAMSELYRVLRPGGWAILQVPISLTLDTTFEDLSISSSEERERAYGQYNHVRLYGRDYVKKLQSVGFIVNEFTWSEYPEYFGGSKNKYGLNPDEIIYFAIKKS